MQNRSLELLSNQMNNRSIIYGHKFEVDCNLTDFKRFKACILLRVTCSCEEWCGKIITPFQVHFLPLLVAALHLEIRSVMCIGAEENKAHCCDPYSLRVQEQPLFLVCSSITIFTPMDQVP